MNLLARGHRILRRITPLALLPVLLLGLAPAVQGQRDTTQDGRLLTVRDTSHTRQTLFTYRDAALAAGFTVLTVAMFPLDRRIAGELQDQNTQANRFFERSATGVEAISSPGAYIIGGSLYAFGRISGQKNVADLGWHGTEAVLFSSGVTNILKGILGRARPFAVSDTNPHDFNFLGGFSSSRRQSFPSGHTTTAFAAAAAVTSEARRMSPRSVYFVGPALYGGATLVGLSRMYHNKHWASDVALGAAVGTFSGLKVVRYSHAHADNKIDRFMLSATITPTPDGGAVLGFSLPTR